MSSFTEKLGNGPGTGSDGGASASEIRDELDRVLASEVFLAARRPSAFLRFVVETSLQGGADGIKEYLIGVEVFDRPPQYDPRLDPVVRIEAGRLRTKLAQYYAGPGKEDPVVIALPKGSYVPEFGRRIPAGDIAGQQTLVATVQGSGDAPVAQAAPPRRKPRWRIWLAAGALGLAAVLVLFFHRGFGKAPLTDKDTIVIGEFANETGNPLFDETLKTAVTHSLAQSPFLNVLPDGAVASTLRLMTLPPDTRLIPAVARQLCLRTSSKAYVTGSIAPRGQGYVLAVSAIDCQSGEKLAEEQVKVAAEAKVLDALSSAASRLRRKLGESQPAIERFDVPLSEATTRSLEALNAYSLGIRAHQTGVPGASLPYALLAIDRDPGFALAYNAAANDFQTMGQQAQAKEFFTKAFQLRQHASEREKLKITADYYRSVTGELDQAAAIFQQEVETYPRDAAAYGNLGIVYAQLGEYQKSLDVTRQSLQLAPQNYPNLGNRLLALGRLNDTKQIVDAMRKQGRQIFIVHNLEYGLAFQSDDTAAMAEQLQWFADRPAYTHYGLELASDTQAYSGHLRKADELTIRAVNAAVAAKDSESGAVWEAIAAQREAVYGRNARAREMAQEALRLAPASPAAESEAALALAIAGDRVRSATLADDLGNRLPLDTQIQALWLPPLRAQLELDEGHAGSARSILGTSSRIEMGEIPFLLNFSCLYPAYVRGQADLEAREGGAAAAEFQNILDHKGIVWNCWTGAVAYLGLARAEAIQSKSLHGADARAAHDRALAAYDHFLTLWKDADPDLPLLIQAKAESARIR